MLHSSFQISAFTDSEHCPLSSLPLIPRFVAVNERGGARASVDRRTDDGAEGAVSNYRFDSAEPRVLPRRVGE